MFGIELQRKPVRKLNGQGSQPNWERLTGEKERGLGQWGNGALKALKDKVRVLCNGRSLIWSRLPVCGCC